MIDLVAWIAVGMAYILGTFRWLRVAQREHYGAGRVGAIAKEWCVSRPINILLLLLAWVCGVTGAVVAITLGSSWLSAGATIIAVAIMSLWPLGLSLRGRTGKLAWTSRLKRIEVLALLLFLSLAPLSHWVYLAQFCVLAQPLVVDVILLILTPVERALSRTWVAKAEQTLASVRPIVVGITGSYGKTSTKLYAQALVAPSRVTVVSPASYNNLMGLSKAINDRVVAGTEVFIAEMGTYGPGEIREMTTHFTPQIAAITTIGEAHLERMKTRETILAAKTEITERASVVILNVDVPELARLADSLEATKIVMRVSASATATDLDAAVVDSDERWHVWAKGEEIAVIPAPMGGHPINLAVAVGIAMALEIDPKLFTSNLYSLPSVANRAEVGVVAGIHIIDDTFNSNPVGAHQALETAKRLVGPGGHIYTITPGMIELGSVQDERNRQFAHAATAEKTMTLAVVGYLNRSVLLDGASGQPGDTAVYDTRVGARDAMMDSAKPGDVILYENDLPDHLP